MSQPGEADQIREMIADLEARLRDLRTHVIREIETYAEDPINRVNNFRVHLRRMFGVVNSVDEEYFFYNKSFCICDNPNPCCDLNCEPRKQFHSVKAEVRELIWKGFLRELEDRAERQTQRKVRKLMEDLPTIKIPEYHFNEIAMCPICLLDFVVGEEACHLFCNENHLFHRHCIKQWLQKQNQCPMCRVPAYSDAD